MSTFHRYDADEFMREFVDPADRAELLEAVDQNAAEQLDGPVATARIEGPAVG